MKKLQLFIRLHGLKFFVGLFFLAVFVMAGFFLKAGIENYLQLESFSRRQMSAMMGFFLMINIFAVFIQLPLTFGTYYYFMQGGGLANVGKEAIALAKVNVKMDQVIGMADAKREAWELVKLLKDRSLLKVIGGKIVKGTIMLGPPGCGKTYLAKAIATECGLPIISATGSDFVGMFVGQGAAQMKALFKQAREIAKVEGGCLIFIDEIDSFARPRTQDQGFGGTLSNNATINQFLTEMDGLRQAENNIVIIAATNATEEDLDPAIMRAGRFDRKIYVTKPNLPERKQIFDYYLSRVEADKGIDTNILARKALWFTPSDIDNMVREAGLIALRENRKQISMKDLSGAYDRVTFGMKSNITMNDQEKLWTAYHEAGHAVIAYLTDTTRDVIKATIIPRKGSLGFISQRPKEELYNTNREQLLAQIKVSLASFVAEKMKFGTTSAGVGGGRGSDFDTAMRIAHTMVWQYGMGKSGLVGDFHTTERYLAEKTRAQLDDDVQDIMQTCMHDVEAVLTKHKALLDRFAGELVKKEELEYDDILKIFTEYGLESSVRDDLSLGNKPEKT